MTYSPSPGRIFMYRSQHGGKHSRRYFQYSQVVETDGVRLGTCDTDTDEYREKERVKFTSHEGQWSSRQGNFLGEVDGDGTVSTPDMPVFNSQKVAMRQIQIQ
jgi:hypothetical protein